jgi:hypothetical protein
MFKAGDLIVYRITKHSTHPPRRAVDVQPATHGEFYTYDVLKYWVVTAVDHEGKIKALTRRGKNRAVHANDPNLRHASWWERWFFAHRFPAANAPATVEPKQRWQAAG